MWWRFVPDQIEHKNEAEAASLQAKDGFFISENHCREDGRLPGLCFI